MVLQYCIYCAVFSSHHEVVASVTIQCTEGHAQEALLRLSSMLLPSAVVAVLPPRGTWCACSILRRGGPPLHTRCES